MIVLAGNEVWFWSSIGSIFDEKCTHSRFCTCNVDIRGFGRALIRVITFLEILAY